MHVIRWVRPARRIHRSHQRYVQARRQWFSVCLEWNVQLQSPAGKISRGSRNRDAVKIPLRGAAIERVYIGGRTERNEPALDSTPAGHAGDFFDGAKSARRNIGQNLASRQGKIHSIGLPKVRQQRSPSSPTDLSVT